LLQILEAPGLTHLHTTVLLAPSVVGLFADTKLTHGLSDRLALTGPNLCLAKVSDNLLCGETLSGHSVPLSVSLILTADLGTFQGGTSLLFMLVSYLLGAYQARQTPRKMDDGLLLRMLKCLVTFTTLTSAANHFVNYLA